jgi:hypothetical protein
MLVRHFPLPPVIFREFAWVLSEFRSSSSSSGQVRIDNKTPHRLLLMPQPAGVSTSNPPVARFF